MKLRYLLLLPCLAYTGYTQADIYKRVEADGHVTYSSTPMKGAKRLDLGPLPTMAPYKESDADFARVNQATQKRRDEERRKILEEELAGEEKMLAEARQNLKDAEDSPQISHGPEGQSGDAAANEESAKAARGQVTLHEKNVEALKMELTRLK